MKNAVLIVLGVALALYLLVLPILTYNVGTSENVSVRLISSPFVESKNLVYEWKGDLTGSCPIELRRKITDSQNVVTNLTTRPHGSLPPDELMLDTVSLIEVRVPSQIANGPAVYQVTEVPKCSWLQRMFPNPMPYPPVHFVVARPDN